MKSMITKRANKIIHKKHRPFGDIIPQEVTKMIKTAIAGVLIAAAMTTAAPANKDSPKEEWVDAGTYRISVFCQYCNEQEGFQTASGRTLEYGQVAMNDVSFGTEISIDGEIFEVTDRVGVPDTVDIFIPNDSGYCQCNTLEYKKVYIKKKGGRKWQE